MKVLVLGDGLLGSEIINQTGWNYISRKKDNIDFYSPETYIDKLDEYDTILNCIAFTDTYSIDKLTHKKINFEGVVFLADICKKTHKKLIHISTDYVYGRSINYATENNLPLITENWYTYYKLMADEYITLKNQDYLICRCSFKPNPFPYDVAWIDQTGNFDYVDVITNIIIKLIKNGGIGLYNVGTSVKTIYDLAKITNKNVKKGHRPRHVPENLTMNLSKLHNYLNNSHIL